MRQRLDASYRLLATAAAAAMTLLSCLSVAASQAPVDVVRTTDGGILRGVITESVPESHILILLANGERRRIAWGRVIYAGPAAQWRPLSREHPQPDRAIVPSARMGGHGDGLRIRFDSPQDGVWFHRVIVLTNYDERVRGELYRFEPLCAAPCERVLPPGMHRFAISLREGAEIPGATLRISQSGTVKGTYVDHHDLRVAGVFATVGVPLGLAFGVMGAFADPAQETALFAGTIVASATLVAASTVLIVLFGLRHDDAIISFE